MDEDVIWLTFARASSILPVPKNDLDFHLHKMKPMPDLMGTDNGVTKRIVFSGAEISALKAGAHDPSFPRKTS